MKVAGSYDLALPQELRAGGSEAFYRELCNAILQGRLPGGARLPSTREFARQFGVARGTVVLAYERLVAEGYVRPEVGAGTFVNPIPPDSFFNAGRFAGPHPSPAGTTRLSRRGRFLARGAFPPVGKLQGGAPFVAHAPDLIAFPLKLWAAIASKRARRLSSAELGDADPRGLPQLRNAIAEYLGAMRGVGCTAEQILILPSVQQALNLATQLLLDVNDQAWVEDPGYLGARAAMRAVGIRVCPIPVDNDGLKVDWAKRHYPRAKLAYVTPAHQAPLGVALTLPRRMALLEWARRRKAWIFEDDYDSEYRYSGKPLAALQALDKYGRVLFAGCFSKTLFPALRIAYLVVPPGLVGAFSSARSVISRYPPVLDQVILAEFMEAGHYARHLRRMRQIYSERRQSLVSLIEESLGDVLTPSGNPTGLDLACRLDTSIREEAALTACIAEGLVVQVLSAYAIKSTESGLLLGFSSLNLRQIDAGVRKLARALRALKRADV